MRGATIAAGLLASTLALAAAGPLPGVAAQCPAHASAVVEHFMGADCLGCWKATPPAPGAGPVDDTQWSMDWIAPAGDAAAMAPGALPEAAERLARLGEQGRALHRVVRGRLCDRRLRDDAERRDEDQWGQVSQMHRSHYSRRVGRGSLSRRKEFVKNVKP
jgi:hypothetical protein